MEVNQKIAKAFFLAEGIPLPFTEYLFHPVRKWRLDYAWPLAKVALEVDGGIFVAGRHNRGASMLLQWEKENELNLLGWCLLKCQPSKLLTIETLTLIRRGLKLQ